jgi:hypothetical protein
MPLNSIRSRAESEISNLKSRSIKKLRDVGTTELKKRLNSIQLPDIGGFGVSMPSFLNGSNSEANSKRTKFRDIEPQRAYLWEVKFPNPFSEEGQEASLYAQQTAIPTAIVENVKRYYAGVEYSYPSRDMSPRIFRVTFYDNDELTNYRFFENWRQSTSQGRYQYKTSPDVHTRDIQLSLRDVEDNNNVATFMMYNCRPTEISEASLSYDSSNLLTFDVLFYFTHKDLI